MRSQFVVLAKCYHTGTYRFKDQASFADESGFNLGSVIV